MNLKKIAVFLFAFSLLLQPALRTKTKDDDVVFVVMTGHEHLYYRTNYKGVPFITLGGGGHYIESRP